MRQKLWLAFLAAIGVLPVVSCSGDNGWTAPDLPAVQPAPSPTTRLSGVFEMTFTADTDCSELPAAARSRTYTATVRGDSLARLTGATFVRTDAISSYWNVVYVKSTGESADFWFSDPPIWESLSEQSYLVIYGDAHGPVGSGTTVLPFWARFEYCPALEPDSYPECMVPVATCESRNHQLTLRPM